MPCVFALLSMSYSCSSSSDYGEVKLARNEVSAESGSMFVSVKTGGKWTLTVDYLGGEAGWITLDCESGSGSKNNVVLKYDANGSDEVRYADIVGTFGSYEYRATLKQEKSGGDPDGPDDPDDPDDEYPGLVSDKLRGWIELPKVEKAPGFAWVFHEMEINSGRVRNYSLYYDAANRVSRWIAYPLNKGLRGSGSRNDNWNLYDPKIPSEYQCYVKSGFGGGYDRGHQIPAADRYYPDAHKATFYPTNMTPQKSELNQRIWADLEGLVRDWSDRCDTLYVVTGCIPSKDNYITDRGGNQVNVPEAYFKALLRYDGSSTLGKYIGIGILLEHRGYSQKRIDASMVMPLDELESITGMDFFHNLPDDIESSVEAAEVSSWWGIN